MSASTTDITTDPDYTAFCEERLADPYPLYHRLREADPVHYSEKMQLWLVTRYADVFAGLRDPRFSSSRMSMYTRPLTPQIRSDAAPLLDHVSKWILLVDGEDHARLRRLVNIAFTPRMLVRWRPRIEQLVDDLLPSPEPGQRIDILNTFCYPLPATIISDMLGIPQELRETFRRCTEQLIGFTSRGGPELAKYCDDAMQALNALLEILDGVIDHRRRSPADDLLSAMIAAEENDDRLSKEELVALCVFLFLAGHETTTNLLASGILLLLRHHDQLASLREDVNARLLPAIEEFLRFEPSVPRAVRQAKQDLDLCGKKIQQGETVVFMIAAANRDPSVFEHPDCLNILRHPNKHLSFGFATHFCLGAQLARLELEIAFRALLKRVPTMSLATQQIRWKPIMGIRALRELEVTV